MILVNKPAYLLPFIFVYRTVAFVLKIPMALIKYFCLGLFLTLYISIDVVVSIIFSFLKYLLLGFIVISRFVYRFIRYVFIGVVFPIYVINKKIAQVSYDSKVAREKRQAEAERREQARIRNRQIEEENKKRLMEIKQAEKEEKLKEKEERKEKLKSDVYINEKVEVEKKTFADKLNDIFTSIGNLPQIISGKVKESWNNTSFAKNARNKKDINRQALLLDFEGDDAKKSETKIMYRYEARDAEGKDVKGYFPAFSKVEVHSFLLSEGYEVYKIETNQWIQRFHSSGKNGNAKRIKTKDLIFFVAQLSTYIKAGIPLVESLRILSRQYKNPAYQRIFKAMIYDLTMGDNFSDAMAKQGEAFPRLLINMVKASEMTGELPEALDDMEEYFTETDKTRKQMVTALMYPAIIMVVAIVAVVFIMVYVVPKFVTIYDSMDGATLPSITVFVLNLSNFLQHNYLWLLLGVVGIIMILVYLFKNVKAFKKFVQYIAMHIPVIGQVIIYNEVTMFTKTFASLLAHSVFITDSMEILNKITNNEIYKMLILDTITNLAKGEKISEAFKDHWAFPIPAYEMIVTGEKTGQLPEMMSRVSSYYQELHRNAVTRIKTFIEPIMILFLTVVVGGIVLSIIVPMFNVYSSIEGLG